MVNPNYIKGRRKEYTIKHELERKGYIVLRTAGSHGFADLIAIQKDVKLIRFIQCKPDNFSKTAEDKLLLEHVCFNVNPWFCRFEVL